MKKIFLILISLFGCTTVPQKVDPQTFYKRDMKLNVNGFKGEGTLVVPKSKSYSLEVDAKGKLDLFTFETCHREESTESAGEGGLFGDRKHVERTYVPVFGIEDKGSCVVRLGGYEQAKGRHSWALIDFEDGDTGLPAVLKCNGVEKQSKGVSICQAKEGLLQQIIFPTEVIVNPPAGCTMERPADLKTYWFNVSAEECVFNFMEKEEPHREHRLTTLGYKAILIQGN